MRVTWSSAATEPREAGCVSTRRASRGLRALSLTGCCRAGRAASGAVCSLARQNDERQPRHYFLTSTTTRSRCRCRRRRRGASTTNCRRPSSLPSDSPSFPFELGEVALGVADHALEAALKLNVIHAVVRSIVRGRQALPGCGAQVGSGGGEGHQIGSPVGVVRTHLDPSPGGKCRKSLGDRGTRHAQNAGNRTLLRAPEGLEHRCRATRVRVRALAGAMEPAADLPFAQTHPSEESDRAGGDGDDLSSDLPAGLGHRPQT